MKLYNQETDKIEIVDKITYDGMVYDANKLSKEQLNSLGYYPLKTLSMPDKRYYSHEVVKKIVDGYYETSYISTDRPIEEVHDRMYLGLSDTAKKYFDQLTEKYHSSEVASFNLLTEQCLTLKDTGEVGFMLEQECLVSGEDMTTFADGVLAKAPFIQGGKALVSGTRTKKQNEVSEFTTIDGCKLYEATPYDCVDDMTGEPTTCYKNNVTDWDIEI